MRGVLSLLGLVVVLGVGLFIYRGYFTAGGGAVTAGTNNPRANVDITGVKNDLLAMAQAERNNQAQNGNYAPLDELKANGSLLVDPARIRDGYAYSAQVSASHFSITAAYSGPATGMPTISIDESMQISSR